MRLWLWLARNEIVLETYNLRAFPKRKKKETSLAVRDPLSVLFRLHSPAISKASSTMFFQATLVRQAKGKTLQRLRSIGKVFVPTIERDRVSTRRCVEANVEASVRRRKDSD